MRDETVGNNEEVCYSYPFGDGLDCTGSDATEHHFTGKERDQESGLDYFYARYYSSDLARFMTPDFAAAPTTVPYAQFGIPQSLNLYAYVGNNPNTGIDPDGHCGGLDNCNPDWWHPPFGPNSGPAPGWDGNNGQSMGGDATDNGSPFVGMNSGSEMTEGEARLESYWRLPSPPNPAPPDPTPPNSRTDVVLAGREFTPTPAIYGSIPGMWEMDWYIFLVDGGSITKMSMPDSAKHRIESRNSTDGGASWQVSGSASWGTASTFQSEYPQSFQQRWFVDGKQVQVVLGRDSNGAIITAWQVRVSVSDYGARPVYSAAH